MADAKVRSGLSTDSRTALNEEADFGSDGPA